MPPAVILPVMSAAPPLQRFYKQGRENPVSVYLHRGFRAATGGEYRHTLAYRRRILPCSVNAAHETRMAAVEYDYPLAAFRIIRDGQDVRKRDTGIARRAIRRNKVAADRVDMAMA